MNNFVWESNSIKYIYSLKNNIPDELKARTICRYFSFSGFVNLIKTNELQLKIITAFEDKHEGFSQHYGLYKSLVRSQENVGKDYVTERLNSIKIKRDSYYASCWVMNEIESFVMWKLYSDLNEGILLLTTVGDLITNIDVHQGETTNNECTRYFCGEIDYGFKQEWNSDHLMAFGKTASFKEENEFRVVVYKHPKIDSDVIRTKIDFRKMARKIITAPYASDSFKTKIKGILEAHSINDSLMHESEILKTSDEVYNSIYKKFIDN